MDERPKGTSHFRCFEPGYIVAVKGFMRGLARVSNLMGPHNLGRTLAQIHDFHILLGYNLETHKHTTPAVAGYLHRKMVKFFTLMTLQIWREAGRLCLELGLLMQYELRDELLEVKFCLKFLVSLQNIWRDFCAIKPHKKGEQRLPSTKFFFSR